MLEVKERKEKKRKMKGERGRIEGILSSTTRKYSSSSSQLIVLRYTHFTGLLHLQFYLKKVVFLGWFT